MRIFKGTSKNRPSASLSATPRSLRRTGSTPQSGLCGRLASGLFLEVPRGIGVFRGALNSQNGLSLFAVVLAMTLLGFIGVSLISITSTTSSYMAQEPAADRALFAAQAGIEYALMRQKLGTPVGVSGESKNIGSGSFFVTPQGLGFLSSGSDPAGAYQLHLTANGVRDADWVSVDTSGATTSETGTQITGINIINTHTSAQKAVNAVYVSWTPMTSNDTFSVLDFNSGACYPYFPNSYRSAKNFDTSVNFFNGPSTVAPYDCAIPAATAFTLLLDNFSVSMKGKWVLIKLKFVDGSVKYASFQLPL